MSRLRRSTGHTARLTGSAQDLLPVVDIDDLHDVDIDDEIRVRVPMMPAGPDHP